LINANIRLRRTIIFHDRKIHICNSIMSKLTSLNVDKFPFNAKFSCPKTYHYYFAYLWLIRLHPLIHFQHQSSRLTSRYVRFFNVPVNQSRLK
ncbi:hypothetical protein T4B_12503, partial [Trichinella pseudospiralis]